MYTASEVVMHVLFACKAYPEGQVTPPAELCTHAVLVELSVYPVVHDFAALTFGYVHCVPESVAPDGQLYACVGVYEPNPDEFTQVGAFVLISYPKVSPELQTYPSVAFVGAL